LLERYSLVITLLRGIEGLDLFKLFEILQGLTFLLFRF